MKGEASRVYDPRVCSSEPHHDSSVSMPATTSIHTGRRFPPFPPLAPFFSSSTLSPPPPPPPLPPCRAPWRLVRFGGCCCCRECNARAYPGRTSWPCDRSRPASCSAIPRSVHFWKGYSLQARVPKTAQNDCYLSGLKASRLTPLTPSRLPPI